MGLGWSLAIPVHGDSTGTGRGVGGDLRDDVGVGPGDHGNGEVVQHRIVLPSLEVVEAGAANGDLAARAGLLAGVSDSQRRNVLWLVHPDLAAGFVAVPPLVGRAYTLPQTSIQDGPSNAPSAVGGRRESSR
jgi:hypothetical protein